MSNLPARNKKQPMRHYPTVTSFLLHTATYLAYVILHTVYSWLQYHVVWRMSGTLKQLHDSLLPSNYEHSAQVLRVVMECRYDTVCSPPSMMDFVLVHEKFVHPSYVLRDHIDPWLVDEHNVVMVEAEQGVQAWRHKYHPFHRLAQCQQAVRVIVLPLHAARRLTDGLGDPKARLIFLLNTARCGGTLLADVYESADKCVVYREPGALQLLASMEQQQIHDKVLADLTRIAMRLYCKPVNDPKSVVAYVFKPIAGFMNIVNVIQKVYPQSSYVFCYRDVKPMANALQKFITPSPLIRLAYYMGLVSKSAMAPIINAIGNQTTIAVKLEHRLDFGVILWAASLSQYRHFYAHVPPGTLAAFKYEHLISNPPHAVHELFTYTNLPEQLVEAGLRAMDADSQASSGLSTTDMKHYSSCDFTPDVEARSLKILSQFGLPASYLTDAKLEGTLGSTHG